MYVEKLATFCEEQLLEYMETNIELHKVQPRFYIILIYSVQRAEVAKIN